LSGNHQIVQYRNVSSIDNYGFNAGYDGSLAEGSFRYGASVTGAVARQQVENGAAQNLKVAPQFFGNFRVSYDLPGDLPTLAVAAHYLARRPTDRVLQFDPPAYAPPQLELRGTVSGPLGLVKGLSYRGSVNYAFASRGAYVIGPNQGINLSPIGTGSFWGPPELIPVDQFRATVGLQYDFGGSQ